MLTQMTVIVRSEKMGIQPIWTTTGVVVAQDRTISNVQFRALRWCWREPLSPTRRLL